MSHLKDFTNLLWIWSVFLYSSVPNVTFMLSIGPCRKTRVLIPLNKSILLLIRQWECWKHCYTCENMKLLLLRQGCYLAMSLSYQCDLTPVTQAIVLPTGRGKDIHHLSVRCHKLRCYLRSASVFPDVLWKDRWEHTVAKLEDEGHMLIWSEETSQTGHSAAWFSAEIIGLDA